MSQMALTDRLSKTFHFLDRNKLMHFARAITFEPDKILGLKQTY